LQHTNRGIFSIPNRDRRVVNGQIRGRYWDRTSDLCRVKAALFR
jgi:hypothetical protein